MKKHLPNFITILNLLSGCIGIFLISRGNLEYASWTIFIAAVFDFLDGLVARATRSYSELGKQLDSLADMVSFGVLPGMILTEIMGAAIGLYDMNQEYAPVLSCTGFIITAFSALRLGKFNIDTRQTTYFLGLPTPMNAIFIASLPSILFLNIEPVTNAILNIYVIAGIIVVNSFLLISEIPLMALKFKHYGVKGNLEKYIFLIASVILILLLKMLAIPLIFALYILISIISIKRNEIQS